MSRETAELSIRALAQTDIPTVDSLEAHRSLIPIFVGWSNRRAD